MKILVVARCKNGRYAPFIAEQVAALEKEGVDCIYFPIVNNGLIGYIRHLSKLISVIQKERPDLVHAHFVFSGMLACLQNKVPVVTTFHGSDINEKLLLPLSRLVMRLSSMSVFVSRQNYEKAKCRRRSCIIPCGVDLDDLQLTGKPIARRRMGLDPDIKYILFAGPFDRAVKNSALAKETVSMLKSERVELLELKGYSRDEVTLLLCAVDALLMTSLNEGSPQIIKEALACGCPIVSVDVGDVRERVDGIEGCYVSVYPSSKELKMLLIKALGFSGKTDGRNRLISDGLDNMLIAKALKGVYECCLRN